MLPSPLCEFFFFFFLLFGVNGGLLTLRLAASCGLAWAHTMQKRIVEAICLEPLKCNTLLGLLGITAAYRAGGTYKKARVPAHPRSGFSSRSPFNFLLRFWHQGYVWFSIALLAPSSPVSHHVVRIFFPRTRPCWQAAS